MEKRLMVEFKTANLSTWEYLDLPLEEKLEQDVQDAKMEQRYAEIKVRRGMDRIKADLLRLVKMIDQKMMDDQQPFDKRVDEILGEIESVTGNLRLQAITNDMMTWAGHREFVRQMERVLQQR